jgi:hypothetical protein
MKKKENLVVSLFLATFVMAILFSAWADSSQAVSGNAAPGLPNEDDWRDRSL